MIRGSVKRKVYLITKPSKEAYRRLGTLKNILSRYNNQQWFKWNRRLLEEESKGFDLDTLDPKPP